MATYAFGGLAVSGGLNLGGDIVFTKTLGDVTLSVADQAAVTITIPDYAGASGELVTTASTQTMVDKTLSSPELAGDIDLTTTPRFLIPDNIATSLTFGVSGESALLIFNTTNSAELLQLGGDLNMATNRITNIASPVDLGDVATKEYVDSIASGLDAKAECAAATVSAQSAIYRAVASDGYGVGGTLTATANGAITIDGVALSVSQRVLIKDQHESQVVRVVYNTVATSEYFLISSPTVNYYVWYNINGTGSDPLVATRTGIQIAVANVDNATVAAATQAVLNAYNGGSIFNCSVDINDPTAIIIGSCASGAPLSAPTTGTMTDVDLTIPYTGAASSVNGSVQNGIYTVTTVGDGSNPFVLTRALDSDGSPEQEVSIGNYLLVTGGATNIDTGFILQETLPSTVKYLDSYMVGYAKQKWAKFSHAGDITASGGVDLTANVISLNFSSLTLDTTIDSLANDTLAFRRNGVSDERAITIANFRTYFQEVITQLGQTTALTALTATSVDINGGNIDGTVIGATTPAAGSFTTVDASTDMTVTTTNGFVEIGQPGTQPGIKIQRDTGSVYRFDIGTTSTAGEFRVIYVETAAGVQVQLEKMKYTYSTDTVNFLSTAVSTSTGTGAVVVAGGVGIGGTVYVGEAVRATSSVISNTGLNYTNGTNSFTIGQPGGKLGFSMSTADYRYDSRYGLNADDFDILYKNNGLGATSGACISWDDGLAAIKIPRATESFSTTSGALIVAGGVGIGGALYVETTINTSGTISGGTISTTGTASATTVSATTVSATTVSATTSLTAASVDINGGNIDGTTIGDTTPAAGTFSEVTLDGTTDYTIDVQGSLLTWSVGASPRLYMASSALISANGLSLGLAGNVWPNIYVTNTYTNAVQRNTTGTLDIGTTSTSTTINIGTDALAKTINIGNTTGASAVRINSGSGNIEFTRGASVIATLQNNFFIPLITSSDSTLTGALVVMGGVGIGGALYAGSITSVGDLTAASVDINDGNIDGTTIGATTRALGAFSSLGIGTSAIPHGAVGKALFAIEGTANSTDAGPHVQYTVDSDDYPVFQQLNYAHGNLTLAFDSYFDGTGTSGWHSSSSTGNFRLQHGGSTFRIDTATVTGVAAGSDINWTPVLSVSNGGSTTFPQSIASTSISTGTVVVTGGVGIGGTTYVGGDARVTGSVIANTGVNFTNGSNSFTIGLPGTKLGYSMIVTDYRYDSRYGATVGDFDILFKNSSVGSTAGVCLQWDDSAAAITIPRTTASTSTGTGALVVGGGVGVGGALNASSLTSTSLDFAGALTLGTTNATGVTIGSASIGVTLNSNALNLATGNAAINIGGEDTSSFTNLRLGSTNTTSVTAIYGGTGGISMSTTGDIAMDVPSANSYTLSSGTYDLVSKQYALEQYVNSTRPATQLLAFSPDNAHLSFGMYFDGGWVSSSVTSNFSIRNFGGNLTFGADEAIAVGGVVNVTAALQITKAAIVNLPNEIASTSSITGALTVAGGVGIGGDLYVGTTIRTTGTIFGGTISVTGTVTAGNLTASTLLTAASADINGGNIDGTTIGATTPAAGTFSGVTLDGTTDYIMDVQSGLMTWTVGATAEMQLGTNALIPATTGGLSLGLSSNVWADAYITTSYTNALQRIAAGALDIGTTSTSTTINIGTDALAKTINIGNTTGTTSVNISSGSGNTNITGDIFVSGVIGTIAANSELQLATTQNGDITVGGGTSTTIYTNLTLGSLGANSVTRMFSGSSQLEMRTDGGNIEIASTSDSATGNINIGTSAVDRSIVIGDHTGLSALSLRSGTNNINLNTSGTGALRVVACNGHASSILASQQRLGAGITNVPAGDIGGGKFFIEGPASNVASGPHIQITTGSDDYPLFQHLNWTHGNIAMAFDSYFDGTGATGWHGSSTAAAPYRISKGTNDLSFDRAVAPAAAGNDTTWLSMVGMRPEGVRFADLGGDGVTAASIILDAGASNSTDWIIGASIQAATSNLYFSTTATNPVGTITRRAFIVANATEDQLNFTGQHRCITTIPLAETLNYEGYIVRANGDINTINGAEAGLTGEAGISINDALPVVELCDSAKDKRVFGVISGTEDNDGTREYAIGAFVSVLPSSDNRVFVNSVGEGAIWVCNINGNIENGDLITSTTVPGIGGVQMESDGITKDDLFRSCTVAKATIDCTFDLSSTRYRCEAFTHNGATYRRAFIACTYHCG